MSYIHPKWIADVLATSFKEISSIPNVAIEQPGHVSFFVVHPPVHLRNNIHDKWEPRDERSCMERKRLHS